MLSIKWFFKSLCLFLASITLLSCGKDEGFENAIIEGYDLRYCACCGGLLIKISDEKTYQWYQQNEKFDITPKSIFPMKVKIKYYHLVSSCTASDGNIEITELEKI
jgi:hypothetical protein